MDNPTNPISTINPIYPISDEKVIKRKKNIERHKNKYIEHIAKEIDNTTEKDRNNKQGRKNRDKEIKAQKRQWQRQI